MGKKMKLKLEGLKVQSFVTDLVDNQRAAINGGSGHRFCHTKHQTCKVIECFTNLATCFTCNNTDCTCTFDHEGCGGKRSDDIACDETQRIGCSFDICGTIRRNCP